MSSSFSSFWSGRGSKDSQGGGVDIQPVPAKTLKDRILDPFDQFYDSDGKEHDNTEKSDDIPTATYHSIATPASYTPGNGTPNNTGTPYAGTPNAGTPPTPNGDTPQFPGNTRFPSRKYTVNSSNANGSSSNSRDDPARDTDDEDDKRRNMDGDNGDRSRESDAVTASEGADLGTGQLDKNATHDAGFDKKRSQARGKPFRFMPSPIDSVGQASDMIFKAGLKAVEGGNGLSETTTTTVPNSARLEQIDGLRIPNSARLAELDGQSSYQIDEKQVESGVLGTPLGVEGGVYKSAGIGCETVPSATGMKFNPPLRSKVSHVSHTKTGMCSLKITPEPSPSKYVSKEPAHLGSSMIQLSLDTTKLNPRQLAELKKNPRKMIRQTLPSRPREPFNGLDGGFDRTTFSVKPTSTAGVNSTTSGGSNLNTTSSGSNSSGGFRSIGRNSESDLLRNEHTLNALDRINQSRSKKNRRKTMGFVDTNRGGSKRHSKTSYGDDRDERGQRVSVWSYFSDDIENNLDEPLLTRDQLEQISSNEPSVLADVTLIPSLMKHSMISSFNYTWAKVFDFFEYFKSNFRSGPEGLRNLAFLGGILLVVSNFLKFLNVFRILYDPFGEFLDFCFIVFGIVITVWEASERALRDFKAVRIYQGWIAENCRFLSIPGCLGFCYVYLGTTEMRVSEAYFSITNMIGIYLVIIGFFNLALHYEYDVSYYMSVIGIKANVFYDIVKARFDKVIQFCSMVDHQTSDKLSDNEVGSPIKRDHGGNSPTRPNFTDGFRLISPDQIQPQQSVAAIGSAKLADTTNKNDKINLHDNMKTDLPPHMQQQLYEYSQLV